MDEDSNNKTNIETLYQVEINGFNYTDSLDP